ncbi:MAG: glyoxalase/bleomycin resistance/extradiol dioxygenase family protein [Sphingomonadales bacterium]|nr:glyoxalase/bleomycin resistance/extradiol dioxygenase family protein [Sphingomonadales bacterium]PIX64611.1 MAG: glyoxalase/bleomycin resistance/extradiol dioxygenase family protein [Sphingomonadales bacterium CG_4_10_14_3_um_filter_58_15]NCO48379.1 glyoxalase/bleomycin resistance/extradiol dioxygenase family protein [Sphingomonadales bacterium]NCO99137.1 glyoxalase/bleomycin resistance/extradiol dioxygenase family protein [Sphingomonadales bacterium]NCP26929.1 glyoxalase/bleomycin resistanc
MQVQALDHINIITSDLDRTADFYADMFELDRRNAPPPLTPENAQWMFDSCERAIFHINSLDCPRAFDRAVTEGPTGSIHHVALKCEGFDEMIDRLDNRKAEYQLNVIEAVGLKQIFTQDPNGILLELNFFGD